VTRNYVQQAVVQASVLVQARRRLQIGLCVSATQLLAMLQHQAHAEQVMSCNELGWEGLSAEKTPLVVLVASSTGDGDPPDNAAKFYATMKCALLSCSPCTCISQCLPLLHVNC
jgi:sulfite reductase alpha subunit-like flavoprotein